MRIKHGTYFQDRYYGFKHSKRRRSIFVEFGRHFWHVNY